MENGLFRSEDMRLGILDLASRRTGARKRLAINFLGKGGLKPWVCVSDDEGGWSEVVLPEGDSALDRIVSGALELALGGSCEETFLDVRGEEMVNQFVIDSTAAVENRYSRLPAMA
jgi:hypothetical protein